LIEFISGTVKKVFPSGAVILVGGVGYGVEMPLNTLCGLPAQGAVVDVWIYTRVREDAIKLYGFLDLAEKEIFSILLSISGVGPKVALAILSTLSIDALLGAVEEADCGIMQAVPGIGKRTAEKILLELRAKQDRLDGIAMGLRPNTRTVPLQNILGSAFKDHKGQALFHDVQSALVNLGYKEKDTAPLVKDALTNDTHGDFSSILKVVLLALRKKDSPGPINDLSGKSNHGQGGLISDIF
jgi:Holliday junction DNA helicase RuvA